MDQPSRAPEKKDFEQPLFQFSRNHLGTLSNFFFFAKSDFMIFFFFFAISPSFLGLCFHVKRGISTIFKFIIYFRINMSKSFANNDIFQLQYQSQSYKNCHRSKFFQFIFRQNLNFEIQILAMILLEEGGYYIQGSKTYEKKNDFKI